MARNGSGVYAPPAASYPAVSGTLIEAAKFNAVIDDIATALTESVAINGQTTMTGDLPMGSHKITGLSDGVAASDACAYGQAGAAAIAGTYAATGKTTPVDADVMPLSDSAASFGLKKLTWANLKATVFAALGVLTAAGTDKATPVDADVFVIGDSAASNATKKLTWANLKATILAAVPATASVPAGTIIDFAGAAAQIPSGYLLCNGAAVSRTVTYDTLFAAIGTLWGVGDGSTTFNVPNFAAGDASVQNNGTVGASTDGQMPAHTHAADFTPGAANFAVDGSTSDGTHSGTVASGAPAGSGTRNFAAGKYVLKCIKY